MGNGGFFTPEQLAERRRLYEEQRLAEMRGHGGDALDGGGGDAATYDGVPGFVDGDVAPVVSDGERVPEQADEDVEVDGGEEQGEAGDVAPVVPERRASKRERKVQETRGRKAAASTPDVEDDGADSVGRRVTLRLDSAYFAAVQILALMDGKNLNEYLSDICQDLVEKNRKKLNQPIWDLFFKK